MAAPKLTIEYRETRFTEFAVLIEAHYVLIGSWEGHPPVELAKCRLYEQALLLAEATGAELNI